MKPLVTLKLFLHRSGEKIGIYFEKYESINILIRKKAGQNGASHSESF